MEMCASVCDKKVGQVEVNNREREMIKENHTKGPASSSSTIPSRRKVAPTCSRTWKCSALSLSLPLVSIHPKTKTLKEIVAQSQSQSIPFSHHEQSKPKKSQTNRVQTSKSHTQVARCMSKNLPVSLVAICQSVAICLSHSHFLDRAPLARITRFARLTRSLKPCAQQPKPAA
jgi:hypothetical protein